MKLSEKIIQKYGVVGSRASWEKLREWSAEAALLEAEIAALKQEVEAIRKAKETG